ncbi:hypothetical protein ACS0TY_018050 [Phlomoides rotata]
MLSMKFLQMMSSLCPGSDLGHWCITGKTNSPFLPKSGCPISCCIVSYPYYSSI